jgi:hypothetical protein
VNEEPEVAWLFGQERLSRPIGSTPPRRGGNDA